jgi:hypothetical protein
MPKQTERTEGFVYLKRLTQEDFSRLFDELILPREEWRLRLRIGKTDFKRWLESKNGPRYPCIDPKTRKKCYRGDEIRYALWRSAEPDEGAQR